MKSMFKILGILMILAVVSLSGCIGEDVTADEEIDVVVVVDEIADEPMGDDSDEVVEVVEPVDLVNDEVEEVESDNGNLQVGEGGDGKDGDYDSVVHFTGLRDDAQTAYNTAQSLADEANVTMIAAEEEVLRCEGLVADGQAIIDDVGITQVALDLATTDSDEAYDNLNAAQEAYDSASIVESDAIATALLAWEDHDAAVAEYSIDPVNTTAADVNALFNIATGLDTESSNASAAMIGKQLTLGEMNEAYVAALTLKTDALDAHGYAMEAAAALSAAEFDAMKSDVVTAQILAESALEEFNEEAANVSEKLEALEAAQAKLDALTE